MGVPVPFARIDSNLTAPVFSNTTNINKVCQRGFWASTVSIDFGDGKYFYRESAPLQVPNC